MPRWRWIFAGIGTLVLLAVLGAVGASLISLDWQRHHAAATRELPAFSGFAGGSPSLVRIPARGMEFRARIAGKTGPGVILLHGFPVTSAMWEPLLAVAGADGYRVVAFDQRGYSPLARPEGAAAYAVPELIDDVLAVADAVGFDRFHLVGHDWGSVVGWGVVLRHPDRVLSWSALSIPHPAAFLSALDDDPDQKQRSSYFRFFSTPWLPELVFTFNGLAAMKDGVYRPMTPAQRDEYLRVFAEPGALTAALNWYRAIALSRQSASGAAPEVALPSLFVWGNHDPAVGRSSVDAQRKYMRGPFREVELDAGHFVMEEQGARVSDEIRAQWARNGGTSTPPAAPAPQP